MIAKKHLTPDHRLLLAICDDNLLGKKIEQKDMLLDLSSCFYKGERISENDLINLLKQAYLINVVGEKSVGFCLKHRYLNKTSIGRLKGIPHAQAILFLE